MADDRERDTEHTTVVTRDGGGRGGAGIVLVLALIVILLAVLFFSGVFDRNDEPELNVMVNSPDVNVIVPQTSSLPPVTLPEAPPPPPDVNVNVTTPPPELPADNVSNTANTVANTG